MTAPRIGGGHWPVDPGAGFLWGSDGAGITRGGIAPSIDTLIGGSR